MKKLYLLLMVFGLMGLGSVAHSATAAERQEQANQEEIRRMRKAGMLRDPKMIELEVMYPGILDDLLVAADAFAVCNVDIFGSKEELEIKMRRSVNNLLVKADSEVIAFFNAVQREGKEQIMPLYRKASLRLHPDKGYDKAAFQNLNDVKDALQNNSDVLQHKKIIEKFWEKYPQLEGFRNRNAESQAILRDSFKAFVGAAITTITASCVLNKFTNVTPKMHAATIIAAGLATSGFSALIHGNLPRHNALAALLQTFYVYAGWKKLAIFSAHSTLWNIGFQIFRRKIIVDSRTGEELRPDPVPYPSASNVPVERSDVPEQTTNDID